MGNQNENDREDGPRTWSFRGYELDPSSFTSAMVHLYRGEIQRANTWRARLDATTNWAVITVAAALTFVFGEPTNPHFVFLLVLLLLLNFLMIEARRYRYYVLWAYRVHLMETDFLASIFTPPYRPSADWAASLARTLTHPSFPITVWQAVGRRFRRNYFWLVSLLLVSWAIKLTIHPTRTESLSTAIQRATVGPVPGPWVVSAVATAYGALIVVALAAMRDRTRRRIPEFLRRAAGPLMPKPRQEERLATIITTEGDAVASRILEELGRGVTALQGTGMYTGASWDVLLCAVTDVQVPHLRKIVRRADPDAFVVVSLAAEVRGGGFQPFEPPS
ncbi:MAG: DUF2270 domain-containing protein [Anaerolineae bacterium]|jgi:uncharacterized membrane protein